MGPLFGVSPLPLLPRLPLIPQGPGLHPLSLLSFPLPFPPLVPPSDWSPEGDGRAGDGSIVSIAANPPAAYFLLI